jgi:hypothetical protein
MASSPYDGARLISPEADTQLVTRKAVGAPAVVNARVDKGQSN